MIDFTDITFAYEAQKPVLLDASISLEPGTFNLVLGSTGSGKTTLLKIMAGLAPRHTGGRLFGLTSTHTGPIGYVPQVPSDSFVQTTVEEELAFSMEQYGVSPSVMRYRMEQVLDELGIADRRYAALASLSGGQQQRVAIAAATVMEPDLLILDEPTSQLDPVAADEVLAILRKLSHDLGITVVLAEHRLERVLHMVDAFHLVQDRKIHTYSSASSLYAHHPSAPHPPVIDMGRAMQAHPLPVSVREARKIYQARDYTDLPIRVALPPSPAVVFQHLTKNKEAVSRGLKTATVSIPNHRVSVLLGRNGAGKSTLLHAIAMNDRSSTRLVPQNAADLFYHATIAGELTASKYVFAASKLFFLLTQIEDFTTHPRDLSAGQQLALALAIQLSETPSVLLLDEPTRGLDYDAKIALAEWLHRMQSESTILVATHDQEFAALIADNLMMIADMDLLPPADNVALATQVGAVTNGKYYTVDQFETALTGPVDLNPGTS